MGYFPACFGHWMQKNAIKKVQDQSLSPSREVDEAVKLLAATSESMKEEEIVDPINLVSESKDKSEDQMNLISNLHHSNVESCTNQLMGCNSDKLVENENGGVEVEKKTEEDKRDGFDSSLEKNIKNPAIHDHRHQDLFNNDKECATLDSKEISSDDNSNEEAFEDCCPAQEVSSESLFSLSIDSRRQVYAAEMGEKEVNSPLKPKAVASPSFKYDEEDKENVNLEGKWTMKPLSKEPIIKQSLENLKPTTNDHLKRRDNEIVHDTSLSSWLVESEKSPQKTSIGNSPESEKNYGIGKFWEQ